MSVDPVTQGIRRGAAVFGFLKAWRGNFRERRQAKRERKLTEKIVLTTPTGETIEHTPPTIPLRTATKATAGTVLFGYPMIEVVAAIQGAQIPIEWLEGFTNGPVFEWLCYSIIPIVIARLTKSPLTKQAL